MGAQNAVTDARDPLADARRLRQLETEDRNEAEGRLASLKERREATYAYIQEKLLDVQNVLAALAPLAGQPFALDETDL